MSKGTPQGFETTAAERIPLLARDAMSDAQRTAADAIINGPRKAIFGPFVPLLRCPLLMERVGALGEALRFSGSLPDPVRELVILVVARETSNQFEWQTHVPLARRAGVSEAVIAAIWDGRQPRDLEPAAQAAVEFAAELMLRHGTSDATYRAADVAFGEAGVVELAILVGYFTMVCWLMNVARTPGPAGSGERPLSAWPA
jgi:4-carboxymuconolactone decarboxylase